MVGVKRDRSKTTSVPTGSNDETSRTPARKADTRATAEFPHAVRFEQGATRFLNGDKITILEVRGTADTFCAENIYRIKGTYTLASHDRAMLAAYTTAMDAENGTGPTLEVQSTVVDRGDGTFTLSCRCHAGVGRMSVFTRPTAEEISAATILERAILS